MLPLRLFLAVQMLGYGTMALWASPWRMADAITDSGGWIWGLLLFSGGVWVLTLALLDHYLNPLTRRLAVSKVLTKLRMFGYYFSGSVWSGLGYTTLLDDKLQFADYMAPSFAGFLLFMAFKDACVKRKKAITVYENRQATVALSSDADRSDRLCTQCIRS